MTKLLLKVNEEKPFEGLVYRNDNNAIIAIISIAALSDRFILKALIHDKIVITEEINEQMLFKMPDYIAAKVGKLMDLIMSYEGSDLQRVAITINDIKSTVDNDSIYINMSDANNIIKFGKELQQLLMAAIEDD